MKIASEVGISEPSACQKFLSVMKVLHDGSIEHCVRRRFVALLESSDLSQYRHQLLGDVEQLLAMQDEDLTDLATETGMRKDARHRFLCIINVLRRENPIAAAHFARQFVKLLHENGLFQYRAKLPNEVQRMLGMDKEEVTDLALEAGMKKDARMKLMNVLDALRSWGSVAEPFLKLLEESGLSKYHSSLLGSVECIMAMDEEDLVDVASEAGMNKDDRRKFVQVVAALRSPEAQGDVSDSDDTWLPVESEPPQSLIEFLAQKGLDKYAKKMYNHPNNYGHEEMLLSMGLEDLLEVAMECDFAKEDCRKLGELVQEELWKRDAAPSIGGKLAETLTAARKEVKKSLTISYLPFRQVEELCHELSYQTECGDR